MSGRWPLPSEAIRRGGITRQRRQTAFGGMVSAISRKLPTMPHVKTGKPVGRPPKKNAQALARILKVARTGLPLKFAAQAGNIDLDTLGQWRARDPEFAKALSQARLAAVEEKWKLIQKAAEDRVDAFLELLAYWQISP